MSTVAQRSRLSWRSWPDLVDGGVDGAIVAFALWTLWYQVGLATQVDLRPSGWVFVGLSAACVVAGALWLRPSPTHSEAPTTGHEPEARCRPLDGGRRALAVAFALVGLVVTALLHAEIGIFPAVALALAVIVLIGLPTRLEPAGDRPPSPPAPQVEHVAAGLLALGVGVLSLFVFKSDADDAYYVNRAAWVAEHGTASLRDTMFGPGTYPLSFGGGLPTPSIEALQGVAASMLGVEAGSVAYLIYAPILAVVFVWVTWRLVREWAPRRRVLVLALAVLFVLASGSAVIGNYSIGRIWQGKVTAYAVLLPIVWWYFSRLVVAPSRSLYVLLGAAGVAFVGLTTSSALLAPMLVGSALLAAFLLRSRDLAIGSLIFLVAPVINGVVQATGSTSLGSALASVTDADRVFGIVYGASLSMAALALVAVAVAVGVARRPTHVLAGSASFVSLAVFLPGLLSLAALVTGAGAVVWRLPSVAPIGVMVGLLGALAVPVLGEGARGEQRGRIALTGLLAAVVAVPLLGGHWIWSSEVGAKLTTSPTWKVDQVALADVRAARELDVPDGLWLMPPVQMQNLAISTAGPFAVVPRVDYLPALDAPRREIADRAQLYRLVSGLPVRRPGVQTIRGALKRLGVTLACVPKDDRHARRMLSAATGSQLVTVGTMRCHVGATRG